MPWVASSVPERHSGCTHSWYSLCCVVGCSSLAGAYRLCTGHPSIKAGWPVGLPRAVNPVAHEVARRRRDGVCSPKFPTTSLQITPPRRLVKDHPMPTSEKQIAANQRNAQKPTGPRTPEGKRAASRNAVKHGLNVCAIILKPTHLNEDPTQNKPICSGGCPEKYFFRKTNPFAHHPSTPLRVRLM